MNIITIYKKIPEEEESMQPTLLESMQLVLQKSMQPALQDHQY